MADQRFQEIGRADGNVMLMDMLTGQIVSQPIEQMSAYVPTVAERWRAGLADALTGVMGADQYDARAVSERLLGRPFARPESDAATNLLDMLGVAGVTGLSAVPRGVQAYENVQAGDYGSAAGEAALAVLEGAPLVSPILRGAKAVAPTVERGLMDFIGDESGSVPVPGFRPPSAVSGPDAKTFGTGWQDVYHWSRSPDDFSEFDLSKSTGSTSRLGPHVGTPGAAKDRFMGWDEPKGFTMPLKANLSAPFNNPSTGEPWTELDLEMFISALADEHGIDRRDVPLFMRQKLAGRGFTSIPYINDVEDPGSISHIMLTDRPVGSDAVVRSRFARFDPLNSTSKNLSAGIAGGVGAPIGLLAVQPNEEQY